MVLFLAIFNDYVVFMDRHHVVYVGQNTAAVQKSCFYLVLCTVFRHCTVLYCEYVHYRL